MAGSWGWSGSKPVGDPNIPLITLAKHIKALGHKIILWTCREGDDLANAVNACAAHALTFDAVNDNLPETKSQYYDSRKIVADIYVDDRGISPRDMLELRNTSTDSHFI